MAAAVSKPEESSVAKEWTDIGSVMDIKRTGFAVLPIKARALKRTLLLRCVRLVKKGTIPFAI